MTRPHKGQITDRTIGWIKGYFRQLWSALRRFRARRLLFLLGVVFLFAFPVIGWWAVLLALAAMYGAAAKPTGGPK